MMNSIRKLNTSGVTRALLYVLIFFQPFNHFNSFREISFYGLLLFFVIKLAKGNLSVDLKDKTTIVIFLLLIWSVAVSLAGPFPMESLNAIRKNLLKEVIVFLLIISEFKSLRDIKPLLWIVVSSFAAVTFASITENIINDWETFYKLTPAISWRSTSTYFFANYADNATFYLPFIAGWAVSIRESAWKKWAGILTCMAGFALVYMYNARTPLLAVLLGILLIVLLAKKYKLIVVFVLTGVLAVSLVLTSRDADLSKYRSLTDPQTYVSDKGLTNRLGLWQVVAEFIEERPLIGYGYGWKKLAWLVQEKDSEEYWAGRPPSTYNYFVDDAKLEYGRVNPHNLLLQIVFEIGLVGLVLFFWLWATVIYKIVKTIKDGGTAESKSFMLSVFGLILSYILINITNGFWQEAYGNMIFLFMASVFVIHRESVSVTRNS